MNAEISLRQHLENLGWGVQYLDQAGYFGRLGLKNGKSCFEPVERLQRFFEKKKLPVMEIIFPGMRIKYLKSLKHCVIGSGSKLSVFWLFIKIMSFLQKKDLAKQPEFMGYIEGHDFDNFPFDEWLTVACVENFDAIYVDSNNRTWKVSHLALTFVTQIEISL